MSELIRICATGELPKPGTAVEFDASGKAVCVANIDGQISAIDNICPHRGGPLAEGMIENGRLLCPWHAWEFNPATGECVTFGGCSVAAYPLTLQENDVFVEV